MKNILIKNAQLINPEEKPINDIQILIQNTQIQKITTKNIKTPQNTITIDAQGQYILPGFIDTHVHLMADQFRPEDTMNNPLALHFYNALTNMKKTLNAGITTVRDAGLADIGVKTAQTKGLFPSPKIQISVTPLTITGGHFDQTFNSGHNMAIQYPGLPTAQCDGKAEVLKKTREMFRAQADTIKVMVSGGVLSKYDKPEQSQFTTEELTTIVQEATTRNKKVMAHAHGLQSIQNCIETNIHSIEHATYIDKDTAKQAQEKNIYITPTLAQEQYLKQLAKEGQAPLDIVDKINQTAKVHIKNMKTAYKTGVKLTMGTDAAILPHGDNLKELEYLTIIGMSPEEAINAGTLEAAKCLGLENQIGSIKTGKQADLIITKHNPLKNIKTLTNKENLTLIIQDGKIHKNTI